MQAVLRAKAPLSFGVPTPLLHSCNLMRVQHSGGGRALHRSPSPLLASERV